MKSKLSLAERMKEYENSTDYKIIHRLPIMMRIDGWKFSKFTKRLKVDKPYDSSFSEAMSETMIEVAKKIQGCILGYTQSDEITLVIRTDQSEEATPWFDNRIQKMDSLGASFATGAFNRLLVTDEPAAFDCRAWPMPSMTEVINFLIWRQRDCTRNSISNAVYYDLGKVVGRGTAKKMSHGKNQNEQQELLFQEGQINWNDYPVEYKRGTVAFRTSKEVETENGTAIRRPWVSQAASIFTSEEGRAWLLENLNPPKREDAVELEESRA